VVIARFSFWPSPDVAPAASAALQDCWIGSESGEQLCSELFNCGHADSMLAASFGV